MPEINTYLSHLGDEVAQKTCVKVKEYQETDLNSLQSFIKVQAKLTSIKIYPKKCN